MDALLPVLISLVMGMGADLLSWFACCLARSADDEDDTDFWLATPGFRESLIEAEADIAAGRTYSAEGRSALASGWLRGKAR